MGKQLTGERPKLGVTIDDLKRIQLEGKGENIASSPAGQFGNTDLFESQYDKGINAGNINNLQKIRATMQPASAQFANASAKLIPSIFLGIVENAGYLGELVLDWDKNKEYSNFLTEFAQKGREGLDKNLPTYRENPNQVFDLGDSAWWIENGFGLLESIGEFLVTGYGVGGALGKSSKLLANSLKAGRAVNKGLDVATHLGTSSSLAYVEGAMSGSQVYKDIYEKEVLKHGDHDLAVKEASKAAATTVKLNTTLNTMLNITSVAPMFKTNNFLKATDKLGIEDKLKYIRKLETPKLEKDSFKYLSSLTGEAGQESLEELVNVYAEAEGRGETTGVNSFEKFVNAVFTEEGALSAILGAVGGVGQTLGTRIISGGDSEREVTFNKYVSDLKSDFMEISSAQKELKDVVENRDKITNPEAKRRKAEDKLFGVGLRRSLENGSGEEFIEDFKNIANTDNTIIGEDGLTDAMRLGYTGSTNNNSYKEKAISKINDIENLTREFNNIYDKFVIDDKTELYAKEVFRKRLNLYQSDKEINNKVIDIDKFKVDNEQILKTGDDDIAYIGEREKLKAMSNLFSEIDKGGIKVSNDFKKSLNNKISVISENTKDLNKNYKLNSDLINMEYDLLKDTANIETSRDEYKDIINTDNVENFIKKLEKEERKKESDIIAKAQKERVKEDKKLQKEQYQASKDDLTNEENKEIKKSKGQGSNDIFEALKKTVTEGGSFDENLKKISNPQIEEDSKEEVEGEEGPQDEDTEETNSQEDNEEGKSVFGKLRKDIIDNPEYEDTARTIDNVENTISPEYEGPQDLEPEDKDSDKNIVPVQLKRKKKLYNAANSIAYRTKSFDENGTNTNELESDLFTPLLSPKFSVGKKLALEIDKTFPTYNDLADDYLRVPIAIKDGNETVGYLHDIDYITPENVAEGEDGLNVEKQKALLSELRLQIFNSTKSRNKATVVYKNNGVLSVDFENRNNLPIDNYNKLAVGKLGDLYENNNDPLKEDVINDKNKFGDKTNGRVYFTHNTPNDSEIAIPVINKTLSDEYVDTLVSAADIFIRGANTEKKRSLVKEIIDKYEYDITKPDGLIKLFTNYVFTFNLRDEEKLNRIAEDAKRTGRRFIDLTGNGIVFLESGGVVYELSKNTPKNQIDRLLKKLEKHLSKMRFNVDITKINKPGEYSNPIINDFTLINSSNNDYNRFAADNLESNIVFNDIGDEYSIFDQPTIEFTLDSSENKKSVTTKNKEGVKEKSIDNNAPKIPTVSGKKQPKIKKDDNKDYAFDDSKVSGEDEPIEGYLIKGYTPYEQKQVVDTIASSILSYLDDNKEGVISQDEAFKKVRNLFETLQSDSANKALHNFDSFKPLVKSKLALIQFVEVNDNIYDEKSSFEISNKSTATRRLKRFLSFIPDAYWSSEDLEIYDKVSVLDHFIYKDLDEVFEDLSSILADKPAVFDDMINVLKPYVESRPWLENLFYNINNYDGDVELLKNDFVKAFSRTYSNYKINLVSNESSYVTTPEGDRLRAIDPVTKKPITRYKFETIDSNRDTIHKIILSDWINNILNSDLVADNGDEIVLKPKEVDSLLQDIQSLEDTKGTPDKEEVNKVLEKVGIVLSETTLSKFTKGRINRLKYRQQFTDSIGLFTIIRNRLSGYKENPNFDIRNPIASDAVIENLAKEESKVRPSYYSSSSRNIEGNIVYSYTLNNGVTSKFKRLKSDPSYVDKMLESRFNSPNLVNGISRGLNWLWELKNNTYFRNTFSISPYDGKRFRSSSKGKKLSKMNKFDQEQTSLGLFQNQGRGTKSGSVSSYLLRIPTKSTAYIISALKHDIKIKDFENFNLKNRVFNFNRSTKQALYSIVDAEIRRMIHAETLTQNQKPIGYHPNMFYFIPELNEDSRIWNLDGTLKNEESIVDGKKVRTIINEILDSHVRKLVNKKIDEWIDLGIITSNENNIEDLSYIDYDYRKKVEKIVDDNPNHVALYSAIDFVVNDLIAKVNIYQTIKSDPALFYSGNGKNKRKDIAKTFKNATKRSARLSASGTDIPLKSKDEKFISLRVQDSIRSSQNEELVKRYSEYSNIEVTDSMELTTLKEHLTIMHRNSEISTKKFNDLVKQIDDNIDVNLSKEDLITIITSIKPVYYDTIVENGIAREEYIKSSSFPLIPQLTKGLDIDKLRVEAERIEKSKGMTVRIAFKSASKLGGHRYSKIFDDDGKIIEGLNLENSIEYLPRSGFRIQLESSYDDKKDTITKGVQETILLFSNILKLNFGKRKGIDLRSKYYKLHRSLYEGGLNKVNGLIKDKFGDLDLNKLSDYLIEEGGRRGFTPNELKSLKIDRKTNDFVVPLWANTAYKKIEPLITSLYNNNVIHHKAPGKPYTMVSEGGWIGRSKDIIYTKSYNPEKGLQPARVVGNTVLPAQVIVPFMYTKKDGSKFNIKDFINEDGLIDITKIPEDLLKMFGYRIPTQSHSFMTYVEVVGFLPDYIDNVIVAPRDLVKQMGADFDYDKLYMYNYKIVKNSDGSFSKHPDYSIENEILDIHIDVMSNVKVHNNLVTKPESVKRLKDLAIKVEEKRGEREFISYIDDSYERDSYLNSSDSSIGIGVKALDSRFISDIQGKDISLGKKDSIVFGGKDYKAISGLDDLSKISTFDNKELKSDNNSQFISASVDDLNDPILSSINSNSITFDAERAMVVAGLRLEDIVYFMNQDIIIDYVDLVRKEPFRDKEIIKEELINKWRDAKEIDENPYYPIPLHELPLALNNKSFKGKYLDTYGKFQIAVLSKFYHLNKVGGKVKSIISASDSFNNGLGKNLLEVLEKDRDTTRTILNSSIEGIENIFNDTLIGYSVDYGTADAAKIIKKHEAFPYNKVGFTYIIERIENLFNSKLTLDDKIDIFDNIRSYFFTNSKTLFKENTEEIRHRLMFDRNKNKSLASVISKAMLENPSLRDNPFLARLTFSIDKKGINPSYVQYKANKAENLDESIIYQGFIDLINNPVKITDGYDSTNLAIDLIRYSYINGGNQNSRSFQKYIPLEYLRKIGFIDEIRDINAFNDNSKVESFIEQYIQHTPEVLKRYDSSRSVSNRKTIKFTVNGIPNNLVYPEFRPEYDQYIEVPTKYFSSYEGGKHYIFKLIESNEETHTYERIDTLGLSFYKEYNSNIPITESKRTMLKGGDGGVSKNISKNLNEIISTARYNKDIINNEKGEEVRKLLSGPPKSVLEKIKESPISSFKIVSDIISKVNPSINYTTINDPTKRKAWYSINNNEIVLNKAKIGDYNDAQKTFLEEMIHAITSKLVNDPSKATNEQKKLLSSITQLRLNARKRVDQNKLKRFDELYQRIKDKGRENLTDKENLEAIQLSRIMYPLINDKEFIAGIMTETEFQYELNNYKLNEGSDKSILQRFIEVITDLINSFGFEVKDGTLLEASIRDVVSLIGTEIHESRTEGGLRSLNPFNPEDESFDDFNIRRNREMFLKIRHSDGQVKRYKDYDKILKRAIFLNTNELANSPYRAKISRTMGEVGDRRVYWSIDLVNNSEDNAFDDSSDSRISKVVNSLKSRIKAINTSISSANAIEDFARISVLTDRKEDLKAKIEDILKDNRISNMINIAVSELSKASKILQDNVSPNDLIYTLKVINLWQHALDFMIDSDERTEDSAVLKEVKAIVAEAVNLKEIWDRIAISNLREQISKEFSIDDLTDEQFESMVDINFLTRELLDISRSGNITLDAVSTWMRNASTSTNIEASSINSKLDELEKEVKKTSEFKNEGWYLFAQTDIDKVGNEFRTGGLVFPVSQAFFNERRKMSKDLKKPENWKKYMKFKKDNHDIVDIRKLFKESDNNTLEKISNPKYEEELKSIFGDDYEGMIEDQIEKIDIYNNLLLAEIDRLGVESENAEAELQEWIARHSPIIHLENVIDQNTTRRVVNNKTIYNKGYKFTTERVKSKWNDPKFLRIKNNPVLFEYYNYINSTMESLYKLVPSDLKNNIQLNSIPNVKKSIIETYNEKGMRHATRELGLWFKESILSDNSDYTVTDNIDPVTLKPEYRFNISTLKELSSDEKSYDLSKTIKIFAHQVLAYKHKSKVEDLIKLSQTVINQALEERQNPSKSALRNIHGEKSNIKGLDNIRKQLDNSIDKFYGINNEKEFIAPKKVLTKEDKIKREKFNKEIYKINNSNIPEDDKKELVDDLKKEVKDLGRNLSITKLIDGLLRFVQLRGMGLNFFSAFTNVNFGFLSGLTWAAGSVDFNTSQYLRANRIMMSSITGVGDRNKIRALMKRYDVLKETFKELYESGLDSKAYILQSGGEYFVQGTTMIASMLNRKIKDLSGVERTLYEAYDSNGEWNTEEFGESEEWNGNINNDNSNKEFFKFKNLITQINKSIHGNYDPESAVLAKSRVLGRALLQFRSWIAEGIANRYEEEKFDHLLGRSRKGRYRTYLDLGFLNSMKLMLKNIIDKSAYDELEEVDKENLRKNFMGLAQLVAISTLGLLIKYGLDDDDDERKISLFYINQLNRLSTDLMFFTSPMAFETITRSAIPAFNVVIDAAKLIDAVGVVMTGGEDTISSGINKDRSRIGVRAAKLFPITAQYYRLDSSMKMEYAK